MLQSWCECLAGEPFCFHTDQIARLTDWQIVELYIRPAVEKMKEFQEKHPATPGKPLGSRRPPTVTMGDPGGYRGPDYEPGTPEHRKQLVEMAFMGVQGLSRERAEAQYDRQLAKWHAEKQRGS